MTGTINLEVRLVSPALKRFLGRPSPLLNTHLVWGLNIMIFNNSAVIRSSWQSHQIIVVGLISYCRSCLCCQPLLVASRHITRPRAPKFHDSPTQTSAQKSSINGKGKWNDYSTSIHAARQGLTKNHMTFLLCKGIIYIYPIDYNTIVTNQLVFNEINYYYTGKYY